MKTRLLLIALAVSAALAAASQNAHAGTLRIVHSIDFPAPDAAGTDIAWDGEHLWATMWDPVNGRLTYELDPSDGSVISSFSPTGLGTYAGHAWDGSYLWITENPPDGFADHIHKLPPLGNLGYIFVAPNSPDVMLTGAAWDGSYLWVADASPGHRQIMQLDPVDMSIVKSFPFFSGPGGLTWDGSSLWCLAPGDRAVFQMDTSGNVLETWSLPNIIAYGNPYGITFDGEYFWVLANGETPTPGVTIPARIYQVAIPEPSTFTILLMGVAGLVLLAWRGGKPER